MWLYVPNVISSPSAQASEGLTLASSLPSPTLDLLEEVWFTWRGKRRQPRLWSRLWKRGGWIRRLSGLTCEHSTLSLGVDRFISSLAATPAKTIALPEKARGQADNGSLLPKSAALPRSAGLILSSAKTSRGTRMDKSRPLSRHWSDWATALRQEYSVRPPLATPCDASDCSSWPSATVAQRRVNKSASMNAAERPTLDLVAEMRMAPAVPNGGRCTEHAEQVGQTLYHNGKKVQLGLESQAKNWSSPKASDPEKAGPNMRGSKGDVPLPGQAANWHAPRANDAEKRGEVAADPRNGLVGQSEHWAAPAAQNYKGSSEGSMIRLDGKSREDNLAYQTEQFFRPPLSPARPITGGAMSSTDSPNSNQPSVKRKLNPIFVEALMRWPTGLSGFERQETAWTRWWQLMPSYLSVLCSRKPDSQTSLFD